MLGERTELQVVTDVPLIASCPPCSVQLMYACADAGIIIVPLNTRWSVNELRHAVVDSGIEVMVILDREFAGATVELSTATAAGPGLSWLVVGPLSCNSSATSAKRSEVSQWRKFPLPGTDCAEDKAEQEDWRGVYDEEGDITYAPVAKQNSGHQRFFDSPVGHYSDEAVDRAALKAGDTRDIFCIVHTSGSTGRSKGVALTHFGQVRESLFNGLPNICVLEEGTPYPGPTTSGFTECEKRSVAR